MLRSIKQIVGITWINFIVYRIMILQREPYIINNKIHILQGVIIIGILMINIIELYSIIKIVLKYKKIGTLTAYGIRIINVIYWKPLASIEKEIMKIRGIGKVLESIGESLLYILKDKKSVISLLLLYTLIPRTIMGISLCIDIIYFHKMAILYKVLFIVIYTISFNVIIGMVKHYCTARKEELETESLIVKEENGNFVIESRELDLNKESLNLRIEKWLLYHNILDVILALELAKQYWLILALRLVNVLMYIIAWYVYLGLIR
jgi:hypothetical protein